MVGSGTARSVVLLFAKMDETTRIQIRQIGSGKVLFEVEGDSLSRLDFRSANLEEADLSDESLEGANLQKVNLRRANLSLASLANADLRGADLRGANLTKADLRCADLRGANFRGARLHRASLRCIRWDKTTLWPWFFNPTDHGG